MDAGAFAVFRYRGARDEALALAPGAVAWLHRGVLRTYSIVLLLTACGGTPAPSSVAPSAVRPSAAGQEEIVAPSSIEAMPASGLLELVPGRVEQTADVPEPMLAWLRALLAASPADRQRMVDAERVALVRRAAAVSYGAEAGQAPEGGFELSVPAGCEPAFTRQEGYSLIAFPPPMIDQSDEDADLVERGVAALQEGEEILVLCSYARAEESEDEPARRVVEPGPAFVLNIVPHAGQWRVQAWAWLGGREENVSP